ncbi:hypothetical protein HKX48_006406 [Thoreauomyces humboldtii]|nr:hypothetical protein HKX48_006406 [Thoreauomyces humboldtii]
MALIFYLAGVLCPNSSSPAHGQFYVTYINLISSTLAVYGLFTLYIVINKDIKEHKPLWKILAVKFIVFFSFWQGLVLDGLISVGVITSNRFYDSEGAADMINAFLACFEMVIAALLHLKAFPASEFIEPGNEGLKTQVWPSILDALSPMHILADITSAPREVRDHHRRRKERRAKRELGEFGNAFDSDAISMVDVDLKDGGGIRSPVKAARKGSAGVRGPRRWSGGANTPLKSQTGFGEDEVLEEGDEHEAGSGHSSSSEGSMEEGHGGFGAAKFGSSDPLRPEDL